MAKPIQLIDVTSASLQLVEDRKDGKTVVRGEFARAGEATENKREYPEEVWNKEIKRLKEAMKDRRVFGELDHPTDGRTSLQRVSHIITGMHVKDGVLIGEAEILPTEKGKILEALLKSGCKVGVSSRGFGSVKPNDSGVDVVQEDYKLVTFDFVAEPADQTAYPEVFFEGVEFPMGKTLDENSRKDADIRGHADADAAMAAKWDKILAGGDDADAGAGAATPNLPESLLDRLAEMRAQIRDEVRGEMLSDPNVARALQVVEVFKEQLRPFLIPEDAESIVEAKDQEIAKLSKQIAEQSLRIKELEEDVDQLGGVAKEAGYKFYLERALSADPDKALILNLIGDVTQFATSDELKTRVEAVREELAKKRSEDEATATQVAEEVERAQALAHKIQESANVKVTKLKSAVSKLAESNALLAKELYIEKRLRNNPRSAKIRSIIESSQVESEEQVDQIIAEHAAPNPHDADEAQGWRARVRKAANSRSIESIALEEETPAQSKEENLFGIPIGQLQTLSGIHSR